MTASTTATTRCGARLRTVLGLCERPAGPSGRCWQHTQATPAQADAAKRKRMAAFAAEERRAVREDRIMAEASEELRQFIVRGIEEGAFADFYKTREALRELLTSYEYSGALVDAAKAAFDAMGTRGGRRVARAELGRQIDAYERKFGGRS